MTRSMLGTLVVIGVLILAMLSRPSSSVDAQDSTEERVAALETQVAELQDIVERQGRRLGQLGATDSTETPSDDEPTTELDEDEADEDGDDRASAPPPTVVGATDDENAVEATMGTRDDPVSLGEEAAVGDWTVAVQRVNPNAADAVLAENQFNEPPQEGRQFFIANLSLTYNGPDSTTIIGGLTFEAVGDSNVAYNTYDPSCGSIPDDLPTAEVFQGGTIEGNVCFQVQSDDARSLILYVEPLFSFDNDSRVYFDLRR